MSQRRVIVLGDETSHGGTVKTASPTVFINGKGVAREGDLVYCPECGGDYEITTGASGSIVNGKYMAREGDVTACGAKLISKQQTFSSWDKQVPVSKGKVGTTSESETKPHYDQYYILVDEKNGDRIAELDYEIRSNSSEPLRDTTPPNGYTHRLHAEKPEDIKLAITDEQERWKLEKKPSKVIATEQMTAVEDDVGKIVKIKTANYGKYIFTLRSFHPNKYFEPLGFFFEGDNRGFSLGIGDDGTSSRIWQRFIIDTSQTTTDFLVGEGNTGSGEDLGVNSDPSNHPFQGEKTKYKVDDEFTKPRPQPYRPEVIIHTPQRRGFHVHAGYTGENYAMPYARAVKKANYEIQLYLISIYIFCNVLFKEMRKSPHTLISLHEVEEFNKQLQFAIDSAKATQNLRPQDVKTYVPSLDVYADIQLETSILDYYCDIKITVNGDGFPNQESFVTDETGKSVFLGTFVRKGYPMTSLRYFWQEEKHLPMYDAHIRIKLKADGNFDGLVMDRTDNNKIYTIDEWNLVHESRNPNQGREKEKPVLGIDWRDWDERFKDELPQFMKNLSHEHASV